MSGSNSLNNLAGFIAKNFTTDQVSSEELQSYTMASNITTYLITSTTTAMPKIWTWTSYRILMLFGSIWMSTVGLILGTVMITGVLFARRKLTGYDVLIVNFLFTDILLAVSVLPFSVTWFLYDIKIRSMFHYIAWDFVPVLLQKMSGINLAVLSIHQTGSFIYRFAPTFGPVAFLRRHQSRQILMLYKTVMVVFSWLISAAVEFRFFRYKTNLFIYNGDFHPEESHICLLTEELLTVWLPTVITAFGLAYIAMVFVVCPIRFRAVVANKHQANSVLYSQTRSGDNDSAQLLENGERHDPGDPGHQIFFESQADLLEEGNGEPDLQEDQEFSRDSLTAWMSLAGVHLVLVFPIHILYLFTSHTETFPMHWYTIGLILDFIKVSAADFLVLLITPRYRHGALVTWQGIYDQVSSGIRSRD